MPRVLPPAPHPCRPLFALACVLLLASVARAGDPRPRVVSLNPSLSAILVEIGAREHLVGVDDWSARQRSELAELPRVGGLYDPSLEAVVALAPDLVVWVPSEQQRPFVARVVSLGIAVEEFENIRLAEVLENIERLGRLVGREQAASERIEAIERARSEVAARVARLPRRRALVVLQREPVFAVGPGSFLDELLTIAGADNLASELGSPFPQVDLEWLIAAAPDVILDLAADGTPAARYWSRWPSLPAVRAGRVEALDAAVVSLPGPQLDRSLRVLARALHGPAFEADPQEPRP